MPAPEPGFTTVVDFIKAVDGDTIVVEVKRRFHVRLNDIDVVEIKEPYGKDAKDFVEKRLSEAKEVRIFVPTHNPSKLMDISSFERIVADVYVDGKNLADLMRAAGFEKKDVD